MNAKHVTLAILVLAWVALVRPPTIHGAGPVQAPLHPGAVKPEAAQAESRAALIVQFGDGSYVTRCVSFAGDSISGLELLTRSGLPAALWGGAVCRIQDEGCDYPVQPCFCQCKGSSCQYWSYWHWRPDSVSSSPGSGAWAYSQIGSGDYPVRHGDIDAWLWGNAQTSPVELSFGAICGPSDVATDAVGETATHLEDGEAQQPHTEGGETKIPSTRQSGESVSLNQYAIFVVMAIALAAGFWFVRRRQGG